MPDQPSVLIAGAGPTGLVLALWLNRLGIPIRIVDKAEGPGTTSRALAVQARTLEFYQQVGLAEAVVRHGRQVNAVNLWASGKLAAHIDVRGIGAGRSPYPQPTIYPQDEHERLLVGRLSELGVAVEWNTELLGFEDTGERVRARLKTPDSATETCEVAYLAGCDGARSIVRSTLRIGFPGGTYEHTYYVADVAATGKVMDGGIHIALDVADFLAVFPLQAEGHARLVGTVRDEVAPRDHKTLSWDDVSKTALAHLRVDVDQVNWFSTYRVHHRVADCFARGRAFLLGDAAHVHSPVGGQGMNTGIGDAVNLSWKLAAVIRGRASPALLGTYEPERIAFARRLVATTDRAFTGITDSRPIARTARMSVIPRLLPVLAGLAATRRLLFRTVSQTGVNYRGRSLSQGRAGPLRGGDRLPWVSAADNFAPLAALKWQVHVYGEARRDLADACARQGLDLHAFPWQRAMRRAGLRQGALYLVRPDGYVALADPKADPVRLTNYFARRGLEPRA